MRLETISAKIHLGADPSELAGAGGGAGLQGGGSGEGVSGGQPSSSGSGEIRDGSISSDGSQGGDRYAELSGGTIDVGGDGGVSGAAGNGVAGQAGSPTPTDPNHSGWTGVREAARARGFDFGGAEVADDAAALDHLLRMAQANRQADYYAQIGRQLAPQAPQIQQYLQQQRGQQQAAPARQPWEAPEFDPRWASLVDRDPTTGILVGKPGVPSEIVQKVNEYADWKTKFDQNPGALINQAAESRAREIAQATFREQFAEHQRQATIQTIMTQNSSWLYQVDQAGNRVQSFDGRPMVTPVGARYMHYLGQARSMGVTDPSHQDAYAKQSVRGEHAIAQQQAALAAQQQAANPQTQQQQFRPNVNPSAVAPPVQRRNNPSVNNDPSDTGLSLRERMMKDLRESGVTDHDIMSSVGAE